VTGRPVRLAEVTGRRTRRTPDDLDQAVTLAAGMTPTPAEVAAALVELDALEVEPGVWVARLRSGARLLIRTPQARS
jgi:hypothetical protein